MEPLGWIHLHCVGKDVYVDASRVYLVAPDPNAKDNGSLVYVDGVAGGFISVDDSAEHVMELLKLARGGV